MEACRENPLNQFWTQKHHNSHFVTWWHWRWNLLVKTKPWETGRAPHSLAWAAAPSSASCRRGEHLDPPGQRGGQSPWPWGPQGFELETGPRRPGRSQTPEPGRSPHSPESFPSQETQTRGKLAVQHEQHTQREQHFDIWWIWSSF